MVLIITLVVQFTLVKAWLGTQGHNRNRRLVLMEAMNTSKATSKLLIIKYSTESRNKDMLHTVRRRWSNVTAQCMFTKLILQIVRYVQCLKCQLLIISIIMGKNQIKQKNNVEFIKPTNRMFVVNTVKNGTAKEGWVIWRHYITVTQTGRDYWG